MKVLGYISAVLLFLPAIASAQNNVERDSKYDMPSLMMLYLNHPDKRFNDELHKVYNSLPFPARYFDHSLGVSSVTFFGEDYDEVSALSLFAVREQIAKKMVSKWFSRDPETGAFDVELLKLRGKENSDIYDRAIADNSSLGTRILEDSGEKLINHTYLLVNDFDCVFSESQDTSDIQTDPISMEDYFSDIKNSGINLLSRLTIKCTSYLFHLNWNDYAEGMFYKIYYFPKNTSDEESKLRYENDRETFTLSYMGKCTSSYSEKNNNLYNNNRQFVELACARVLEKNMAVLGRRFEGFRIKANIISTDPLLVDLGLKEGISEHNLFEVLERVEETDGTVRYIRRGIIKPIGNKICDNRYTVISPSFSDVDSTGGANYSEFETVSGGDFYPGMLVRELSSYSSK